MAEKTSVKLHNIGFHNVQFKVGDFQDPNLEVEGPFDAIFSIRAIEYMQDKVYALSRIHQLLRKGGFALIVTKNPNTGFVPFAFLLTRKLLNPPRIFSNLIHYRDLLSIAKTAGFGAVYAYPAITSFYSPLLDENQMKILSDRIHEIFYKRRINPVCLTLIESYALVIGRTKTD
jgi:SAM-dependent methyltransferase